MSRENVEIVRRFYDIYAGRYDRYREDPSALWQVLAPDIEWYPLTGALVEGRPYKGHEGVKAYFEDLADAWEESDVSADRFIDADDVVIVVGQIHAIGRGSGLEIETPAAWVWRLRRGQAVYMRVYLDRQEALEAVGLSEQDTHIDP
jgi:ketosteroid isomerase-like protein